MSFTEAVRICFQKYADFSGRARRSEYWWWFVFQLGVVTVLGVLTAALSNDGGSVASTMFALAWLGLTIPSLAVSVRRLHDTGRSGWYWLIGSVPLVGAIIVFVALASAGDPSENMYGPPTDSLPS